MHTVIEPGVNASYVDDRISLLENSLLQKISGVSSSATNSITQVFNTSSALARIEHLDELDLTDSTITNATITGGTITNATISGDITATDFSGVLAIAKGGTGTSSAPTYGQLLVGNTSSGYDFTATSSLGLPTFDDLHIHVGTGMGDFQRLVPRADNNARPHRLCLVNIHRRRILRSLDNDERNFHELFRNECEFHERDQQHMV